MEVPSMHCIQATKKKEREREKEEKKEKISRAHQRSCGPALKTFECQELLQNGGQRCVKAINNNNQWFSHGMVADGLVGQGCSQVQFSYGLMKHRDLSGLLYDLTCCIRL